MAVESLLVCMPMMTYRQLQRQSSGGSPQKGLEAEVANTQFVKDFDRRSTGLNRGHLRERVSRV